jgi:hypothetical protein
MATFNLSAFTTYSSPRPSQLYSSTYFCEINFRNATEVVYPAIYEPNTISGWTFTSEVPTDADSDIRPNEGIPDIADLCPIMREMEQKFSDGARSVAVSLSVPGGTVNELYHLSKAIFLSISVEHLSHNH